MAYSTNNSSPKKFTSEDVLKMPLSKQKELNNPSHPDYQAWSQACEDLYRSAKA